MNDGGGFQLTDMVGRKTLLRESVCEATRVHYGCVRSAELCYPVTLAGLCTAGESNKVRVTVFSSALSRDDMSDTLSEKTSLRT